MNWYDLFSRTRDYDCSDAQLVLHVWFSAYEEEYEEEDTPALAYEPPKPSYGDDEEGQILEAAEVAGINMNDSQALIAFTKEWKATNT